MENPKIEVVPVIKSASDIGFDKLCGRVMYGRLIQDILFYGAIVGSYARWACTEDAPVPNDIDVAPFNLDEATDLVGTLVDEYGYNMELETDNAWNLRHEWEHYPEIDILKQRTGMPLDVILEFPLYNEAFAMVSPVLVITTAEGLQAERSGVVSVQNWYDATPSRIGKLLGKKRTDEVPYILVPQTEDSLMAMYDGELDKIEAGFYTDWKDKYDATGI